ncbi:MAG: type II toxin-antitoxin system death-on-curing family toxin [Hyphomicrobiales bacterium]
MIWLTKHMVEAFHRESLARFGGADGVRDPGLWESALARPENIHAYEPEADVFRLAAAYCTVVVKNHPFIDGNKRTGTLCAVVFLGLNGVDVEFDEPTIVTMIYGLAAGEVIEDQLAAWLRASAVNR